MPIPLITSIISAISILAGSAMGAWFSWLINNKMHKRKMREEYSIIEDNRKYEEQFKFKEICANANLVRLDVCTSIYQSIRTLLERESSSYIYPIPINKNYSCAISTLSDNYSLKELSYLYQLYGIIERVNNDILNCNFKSKEEIENVLIGFEIILNKIYGENLKKFFKINIDNISYKDLYDNEYIKLGYKEILEKLDNLCYRENINN